jgi:hypothetical protein
MITSSSPAQPSETILVYLTGLGTLSGGNATATLGTYFEDPVNGFLSGNIAFAGSQSTVGGGYQMNVQLPSNISTGDIFMDIYGPDSYNSEVVVPVGSGSTSSIRRQVRRPARPTTDRRPHPKFVRNPKQDDAEHRFGHVIAAN